MIDIFIPHPEIANHYEIRPGYHLITSDQIMPYFKWSRMVRKNYIPGAGFLGHHETERIDIRVYKQESEFDPVVVLDQNLVAEQLKSIMVDDRETIFHYYTQGKVQVIVTGVEHDIIGHLPEHYRYYYYETRV